jgi:hypothetical protein
MFAGMHKREVDAVIAVEGYFVDGYAVTAKMIVEKGSQLFIVAAESMSFNRVLLGEQGSHSEIFG